MTSDNKAVDTSLDNLLNRHFSGKVVRKDLTKLVKEGAWVRLVKGAYKEPPAVAYPQKHDVDAAFVRLAELLLALEAGVRGVYLAAATHDEAMIEAVQRYVAAHDIARDAFEFQMLYGIRRDRQSQLTQQGYGVRVYIPYGAAWAYLDDEGKDAEQTDGKIADETVKMLERAKDGPFFIAAGFYRPHVPDVAPKAYFDLYPPEKIRIEDAPPEHAAVRPLVTSNMWPANYDAPEAERRRMMQAYYASTTFMDAQVGLVLDALDRLGLKDNTIVIFMSDHGYMLGEHGQWQKNALWESSLRTPLIIRSPGAQGNGAASPKPVELLDIYPTLVELAGLPAKGGLEGVSLTPLLAAPRKAAWDRPAYSQVQGGRSVRTDRWRYTEWEGGRLGASLYDMVADPRELRNLAGEAKYAPIVRKLQALLPNETVEPRGPAMILYDRAAGLAKFETYADALAKDEGKK